MGIGDVQRIQVPSKFSHCLSSTKRWDKPIATTQGDTWHDSRLDHRGCCFSQLSLKSITHDWFLHLAAWIGMFRFCTSGLWRDHELTRLCSAFVVQPPSHRQSVDRIWTAKVIDNPVCWLGSLMSPICVHSDPYRSHIYMWLATLKFAPFRLISSMLTMSPKNP